LEVIIDFNSILELAIEAAIKAGEKTLEYYQQKYDVFTKFDNSPLTQADLESNLIINKYLETSGIPVLSEENQMVSFETRKSWHRYWLVDPLDGTKEFIKKNPEYSVNIALVEENIPVLGVVFIPAMGLLYYGSKNSGSYKATIAGFNSIKEIRSRSLQLPLLTGHRQKTVILVSRSHLSEDTKEIIGKIQLAIGECIMESYGSSVKFCLIAEGNADIYPRIGPTMEWDTAASQAILEFSGCDIIRFPDKLPLLYNKESLLNPSFIAYRKEFKTCIHNII
jgi:3'(2'), 5'-bisphosphate nucleotidase